MKQIIINKGRTVVVPVSLDYDVSTDTFTSEIREEVDQTSPLIATWTVTFATDGTDGEIVLTLDDSITTTLTKQIGYMDLKRTSNNTALNVFDEPIQVLIKNSITV